MKKTVILLLFLIPVYMFSNPIIGLLERIDKGASKKFKIEIEAIPSETDFFELDQEKGKVVIRGNNYVSIATGINWYLKYYANIHLSWNGMATKLPAKLPPVTQKERRETNELIRYYLNYCTFSYSMAFWNWERWQKEIDWMALHGINMPLAITGTEAVWVNMLSKLGYSRTEIDKFIAGSGFFAWWQMNNIEGWGGPNSDQWYKQQVELQKRILSRYKEYGMQPVFPGYAGMLPSNAKDKLGLNVTDPGFWGEFKRPAFLQPTDSRFSEIATLYYSELENLFGKAKYYAIDPFHEGGRTEGVDLDLAGKAIMNAIKKDNPDAVWVAQAWQANPRPAMINNLEKGDLLILDLFSESRPMWGPEWSLWYRQEGYGKHDWVYCMLLNFGGRTGLFGKMQPVIDNYYAAKVHKSGETLTGIGATMEAIENNPVMYELLFELPWRKQHFTKEDWLKQYTRSRYGNSNPSIDEAWKILSNAVYNCPKESVQEGTTESVFAACPQLDIVKVSCCSATQPFYNTDSVKLAAQKMLSVVDGYKGNNNFEYDLVDIVRQTIANRAYYLQKDVTKAYRENKKSEFLKLKDQFLSLMMAQDSLLDTRPEFMVGSWINQAKKIGNTSQEKYLYEWNARTQITVWGSRVSAETGLNDYAYKEWSGILRDYYYTRWDAFFNYLEEKLDGKNPKEIDFYNISEKWTNCNNSYPDTPQGDPIRRSKDLYYRYVYNQ